MDYEGDGDTNCSWSTLSDPKNLVKGLEELEIRGRTHTI